MNWHDLWTTEVTTPLWVLLLVGVAALWLIADSALSERRTNRAVKFFRETGVRVDQAYADSSAWLRTELASARAEAEDLRRRVPARGPGGQFTKGRR